MKLLDRSLLPSIPRFRLMPAGFFLQSMRMKILASANSSERKFSAWIGGSILASLVSRRAKLTS